MTPPIDPTNTTNIPSKEMKQNENTSELETESGHQQDKQPRKPTLDDESILDFPAKPDGSAHTRVVNSLLRSQLQDPPKVGSLLQSPVTHVLRPERKPTSFFEEADCKRIGRLVQYEVDVASSCLPRRTHLLFMPSRRKSWSMLFSQFHKVYLSSSSSPERGQFSDPHSVHSLLPTSCTNFLQN